MVLLPLGDAVLMPQVAIMGISLMIWWLFQSCVAERLVINFFTSDAWLKLTGLDQRKVILAITSSVFSVAITVLATINLLFPVAAVKADRIYGLSEPVQATFAFATGFFMWNTLAELRDFDWPFLLHHVVCILVYLFGQYPFLPQMGCFCLLFEASTPAFCLRNVLKIFGRDKTALYSKTSNLFAVVFIIVRILIGVPVSISWWGDMLTLLGSGKTTLHSTAIVYFYLVANLFLNGLNIYWFLRIMNGIIKKFGAKKSS